MLRKVPKLCFGGKIKRHAEVMTYIGDGRRRLEMVGKVRILGQSIGLDNFAGGLDWGGLRRAER